MKKLIAALSLLFVLSLTACGNSDAALRQENEALPPADIGFGG